MFDTLSDRLDKVFTSLRGKGRLSDADIDATAREIRIALLEADVALPVVKAFIAAVKERARGAEVSQALNPAQQVVKIVNEELVGILGGETRVLRFAKTPPTVIMLAGLQGAGKTTLAGKLAKHLKAAGHAPLLVACDLQRPNAVQQLQVVGGQAGVDVFAPYPGSGVGDPVDARARRRARPRMHHDVVVVDTAGRLGIDADMMQQAIDIRAAVQPDEVLFVVDAMIGRTPSSRRRRSRTASASPASCSPSSTATPAAGGAVGAPPHRPADHVRLHRREARRLRRLPPRAHGLAHPRHGRRPDPHRAGREVLRRRHGRAHGRQDDGGQGVRPRGLPRADDAGQEDGLAVEPARHAARHGPDEGRAGAGRRQGPRPDRRHHPVDDAAGAAHAQDPQRLAPHAHRQGLRRDGHRGQQPRRPLLRRAEDDEADGRHGRHDGMPGLPGGRKAKRQQSSGKKGKKGPGRAGGGPSRALPPAAAPGAAPTGLPQGFPQLPQGFPPAAGGSQPPDPFGLRRPR
jgi:hypothetical protein